MFLISGPVEKRTPIKHDDNLKTGEGRFVTPEKTKYIPADRPKQVKPTDNLKTGQGEFVVPEKTQPRGNARVFHFKFYTNSNNLSCEILVTCTFFFALD